MMNGTCILFGVLFLAAGVLFAAGRLHTHVAAWKQMTEAEKKQIRIRPLCRNIGVVIAAAGGVFVTGGLWPDFREHWFVLTMVLWLIAAGADLFYIEKSRRYEEPACVPAVIHSKSKEK